MILRSRHANSFVTVLTLIAVALVMFISGLPIAISNAWMSQLAVTGTLYILYLMDGGHNKLRKDPVIRIAISALTLFIVGRYFSWRAGTTIPYNYGRLDLVLGFLLLIAEGQGIISSIFGLVINLLPLDRQTIPLSQDKSLYPTVDILVPTYNEDPVIVETTVIAATQMQYPPNKFRVYILDDGGTDAKCGAPGAAGEAARERAASLRAIAARYGAHYLTRPANLRAKAGNINSALEHITGELILILDCDHVPTEDFLRRTVGFFLADQKLFLVQTPHNFVTADPIERNLKTEKRMPSENELFYSVMQPGLDFWGSSFFCGSAAVLRRSVIDEIGGISGKSITEDAETTVKAMSHGYKTAFYNRPMVSGLQPETFTGFILQRVRWAQGMIQIFILDNVWTKPHLTLMQKILFTNFAFYWLFPLSRGVLLLMPPLFLCLGFNVAVTTPLQLLVFAVPYFIANLLNSQYFYGRVRWPLISQIYETAQAIFLAAGIYAVVRHPTKPTFKVTPKGEVLEADFVSTLATPFYILATLSIISIVFGGYRFLVEPERRGSLLFVGFWVFLDALTLLGVMGALAERRQTRASPRAFRREPIWVRINTGEWQPTKTLDLSRHGAGLLLPESIKDVRPGDAVEIFFRLRGMSLMGRVRSVNTKRGQRILGMEYTLESAEDDRFAVHLAFGNSATLVGMANRRHTGLSTWKAFIFLVLIGFGGGLHHIQILLRRLRVALRQRRSAA